MATPKSTDLLVSVINHIILPTNVPAKEDHDPFVNQELVSRLIQAATTIRDHTKSENLAEWESLLSSLKASKAINLDGHLNHTTLRDRLSTLSPNISLFLHVSQQNAGVHVFRQKWFIACLE